MRAVSEGNHRQRICYCRAHARTTWIEQSTMTRQVPPRSSVATQPRA